MKVSVKQYLETFLAPADKLRWTTEAVRYPRCGQFYQRNRDEDIKRGVAIKNGRFVGLSRLKASTLKHHVCLRENLPTKTKCWILTKYEDAAPVSFIQIDFDRHVHDYTSPEEQQAIEKTFGDQIDRFLDLELPAVWTTSPGNFIGGEHIQGRYAWIKLSEPLAASELRERIRRWKQFHGLEGLEASDTLFSINTRLPGQLYVECCDAHTGQLLEPVEEKPSEALAVFCREWDELPAVSPDDLFGESDDWFDAQPEPEPEPAVPGPEASEQLVVVSTGKRQVQHWTEEECLKEPNTFIAATRHKIGSRLAHQFSGDNDQLEYAASLFEKELKQIRPATSRTCGNPHLLHATVRRWLRWYFRHFDPSQRKRQETERDREDKKRVEYCRELDDSLCLRALSHLSFKVKSVVLDMKHKIEQFNGRVSFKEIYEGNLICSKRQWDRIRKTGVFVVLDEYDQASHKCRQWGLAKKVVEKVRSMVWAREAVECVLAEYMRNVDEHPLSAEGQSADLQAHMTHESSGNDMKQPKTAFGLLPTTWN